MSRSAVNSIGSNCCSSRSRLWKPSGTRCSPRNKSLRRPAAMLLDIKGIGPEFAAILWSEGLFRHFDNRRQIASYAGLAPTPWQSGSINHEQGVSKAGNARLRQRLSSLPAMVAQSAAIGAGSVVRRTGQAQWRRHRKRPLWRWRASCCGALEICDRWCRHRGAVMKTTG